MKKLLTESSFPESKGKEGKTGERESGFEVAKKDSPLLSKRRWLT